MMKVNKIDKKKVWEYVSFKPSSKTSEQKGLYDTVTQQILIIPYPSDCPSCMNWQTDERLQHLKKNSISSCRWQVTSSWVLLPHQTKVTIQWNSYNTIILQRKKNVQMHLYNVYIMASSLTNFYITYAWNKCQYTVHQCWKTQLLQNDAKMLLVVNLT